MASDFRVLGLGVLCWETSIADGVLRDSAERSEGGGGGGGLT